MEKHTPGPWTFDAKDDYLHGEEGRGHVAIKAPDGDNSPWYVARVPNSAPDKIANARLIAAAPELLEALEWMLVDGTPDHKCGGHGGSSCVCICAREKAEAAIAKAKG